MNTRIIKEGQLQFYNVQKKKWYQYWVQLAEILMVGSLEVYPTESDTSCNYSAIQVMGNYKNQSNCFQIKAEGITYTLAAEDGASLHEWITAIHANIKPRYKSYKIDSHYSTVNDIEINPDFTLYNGEDSKDSSPTTNLPKHLKQRRRSSSAADKFRSIFKSKKNKRGKGKMDFPRASSDTELPPNPSPPNLDELYSKINKKTKLRKKAHAIMATQSPLDLNDYKLGQRYDDKLQACHSEPTNMINCVDAGLRGKTKRLRTRSERGWGRIKPEVSSSDEEINDNSPRRSSITNNIGASENMTSPRRSSITNNIGASENMTSPMFLFPPPPSRSPSDLSELHSPKIFKLPNKLSSPIPKKKASKYSKETPVVHDPKFEFQTSIDNSSVLLPEHEITILKLKTNSSSDSVTEELQSPPTKEGVALVHPRKRLSVGSPPVSAKDLETSFLFPEKDTLTSSLPITSVMDTQICPPKPKPRVVTKVISEVGKFKQPYVNLPQLVKSSGSNGFLANEGKSKIKEMVTSFSSDSITQRAKSERFPQTDNQSNFKPIPNIRQEMELDKIVPPRPAKPPKQLQQRPEPSKRTSLKSNLKQPQYYNSISSTASSNALSKDSQEVELSGSARPRGLKVNFGGTTEIPFTPNTNNNLPDNSHDYGHPKPNNSHYHQGFNSFVEFSMPYGNFHPQHVHFASDPQFRQVMVPNQVYYPSSLHVPSMSMIPNTYDTLVHDSLQEELNSYPQVTPTYTMDRHGQLPGAFGYNSSIPYYMSPPPFASYSTDPNIKELRSTAYSAYSGEYYQSHSFKENAMKPSRPAPAPPPPRNPPNTKLRMLQDSRQVPIPNANRASAQTETMV